MRKILCFWLMIIPILNFGINKKLPNNFIYVGVNLQQAKIKNVLRKMMSSQFYQSFSQKSLTIKAMIGFDPLNDPVKNYGVDDNKYIGIYYQAQVNKIVFEIPTFKPSKFLRSFRRLLKTRWGGVKVKRIGRIRSFYTKHPRFKNKEIYFVIIKKLVYLAPDKESLVLISRSKENSNINKEIFAKVDLILKTEKPLFYAIINPNTFPTLGFLKSHFFLYAGIVDGKIKVEFMVSAKEKIEASPPTFLEDNPLALVVNNINANEIDETLNKFPGGEQISRLIENLNIKQTLGTKGFIVLQDFNAMGLIQQKFDEVSFCAGIQLKDSVPYEAMLESLMAQNRKEGQESDKISATKHLGHKVYSVNGISIGMAKVKIYITLFQDYLILSTNIKSMKKVIFNYLNKKEELRLPVANKNLFMFINTKKIWEKLIMVFPMIKQLTNKIGINIDHIRFLTGNILESNENFLRAAISVFLEN